MQDGIDFLSLSTEFMPKVKSGVLSKLF